MINIDRNIIACFPFSELTKLQSGQPKVILWLRGITYSIFQTCSISNADKLQFIVIVFPALVAGCYIITRSQQKHKVGLQFAFTHAPHHHILHTSAYKSIS